MSIRHIFSRVCCAMLMVGVLAHVALAQSQEQESDATTEELLATFFTEEAQTTTPAEEAPPASAQPQTVTAVEVQGNHIISSTTILNKMKLGRGAPLAQEAVNEDIKRLYGTGFFQDVKIDIVPEAGGVRVVVVVDEKPIVQRIIIQGSTVFSDEKLRKDLNIIEGQILDRRAIKEGVATIRKKYANKGYKFVDIRSDVEVDKDTKEAVVYIDIREGEKYTIEQVSIEGAKTFPPRELKRLMKTKARTWWNWWFAGVFKEDVFEDDLERLKFYYQKEGFLDVKIVPDLEYETAAQSIHVHLLIEEGQPYQTGSVHIEGNIIFPESDIWERIEMLPGLTFSQFRLNEDVEAIRDFYAEQGYIAARITPETQFNRETGKVDVSYGIVEGDLFFVDKVKIRGNTKTKDIVIRRELRIRPGERIDGANIRRSKQRLDNLGFFEEVTWDTEQGSVPNSRDVIFTVKERQTGELSFGAGVSSVDKFIGFAEITQRNFDWRNFPTFTGDGQRFSLRGRLGSFSTDADISFVEPYLFERPISFSWNLFDTVRQANNTDFDTNRLGASIGIAKAFTEFVSGGVGYTVERVKLEDIEEDASSQVTASDTSTTLSRVRFHIARDSRDNVFNPASGSVVNANIELVGSFLGGEEDLYKWSASATKYWSFRKKHIVSARVRLGVADEFGDSDQVPVFERFYAGGLGSVRGFNPNRVGPIDGGSAIGGNTTLVVNLEYTFPLFYNFDGAVFFDIGQVDPDAYSFEAGEFALSVGPGIKVATPIGPIAFYYGFPFANRDTEDRNGRFEFSLSRGF